MRPAIGLMLALALFAPADAPRAAETYHTCAGFVSSVPATITTQGVWCLRQDLSTAITSGAAITIATNNVTLDCNGFKLGGLAAGPASLASGTRAADRQNVTIRNCNMRGFHKAIEINGGAGHVVEDNRLDNNLLAGILAWGESGIVRNNQVYDTGGAAAVTLFLGGTNYYSVGASPIATKGMQVLDNVVDGAFGPPTGLHHVRGIGAAGPNISVRGNIVRRLSHGSTSGTLYGIDASFSTSWIRDNSVSRVGVDPGVFLVGIDGGNVIHSRCEDNFVLVFTTPIMGCVVP